MGPLSCLSRLSLTLVIVAKRLDGSRCHFIYGGRPRPRRHCVRWGPSCPHEKRYNSPPPHFSAHCMLGHGRPSQKLLSSRFCPVGATCCNDHGEMSPFPKRVQPPIFSQCSLWPTAGWTKMPLGMEEGLGPGDFVLDGDPAPLPKKGRSSLPNFRPISIVAKRLDASRCHLVWMLASAQGTLC